MIKESTGTICKQFNTYLHRLSRIGLVAYKTSRLPLNYIQGCKTLRQNLYLVISLIFLDLEFDLKTLQAAYDDVDTALLFIGYPRSRHTIVSAILDAHPNIMLSNEMNLIGTYGKHPELSKTEMFDKITALSYRLATIGRRSWTMQGNATMYVKTGYKVPNQWQGTFDGTLKVTV